MSNANLRAVNLNLLPVLQALLREQSLVGASRSLALSQPAVHAALAQLRGLLGDPLLVRVGRSMVLTPRALSLVEPVERACEAMRRVVEAPAFDAARSRRCFFVAGSDYAPVLIGPPLVQRLARQAPGVSVQFLNVGQAAFDRLRQGEIDLVIVPRLVLDALHWPAALSVDLWTERFIHVVRPGHPLTAVDSPSSEQIAAYPQFVFEPAWYPEPGAHQTFGVLDEWVPTAEETPAGQGLTLRVEQFCALPLLAANSDAVVRVPQRLVEWSASHLPLQAVGKQLPAFEVALAWSAVDDGDPAHRWFRTLVIDACS